MATGGEVQGQCPVGEGSEDLDQLKCQPCLEDGHLREAVGMCVDCQDYLCSKCYDGHTLPKPCRNHQLLDREQMMQEQIRISPKDVCTEKCPIHEDEVIKFYCTIHCKLGCTACITINHATCKSVQYILQEAKDLANSEEYREVESQLKSALEAFETVSDNVKQNVEELDTSYTKALDNIKEYRRKVEEAFDKIEAKLAEQAQAIKATMMEELLSISGKYTSAEEELQASLSKIEALQKAGHSCSSYTEMMRTKEKLEKLDAQIREADEDQTYRQRQIRFTPNQDVLDTLENQKSFGILSVSDKGTIVSAKHVKDINVKTGTDTMSCMITGFAVLPDDKLVLADRYNKCIKTINVQDGQLLTSLRLSSGPWDVTTTSKNKLAATLPDEKKVVIVTVGDSNLGIDRTLTVNGDCRGVDYRNDRLAVSFVFPHKVEVINLQGSVLHTISTDKQGQSMFNCPYYLTYGHDDTTVFVSNYHGNNVMCVKLDGTVVAKYTGSDLKHPLKPVVDRRGNVYVCGGLSHTIYQISKDCQKVRVLLTSADGLNNPHSLRLSEERGLLYVGMVSDIIKVYSTQSRTQ